MRLTRVRATITLGVAGLVALSAAAWFLVLSPRLSTAADLTAQTEQVEFSTTQMQNRYHSTLEQSKSATEAAQQAQALFTSMPQQADLPAVLLQIIDAAKRAGIDAKQISVINTSVPRSIIGDATTGSDPESPAGAVAKGLGIDLAQLDLDVTVNGTRGSLLGFLDNLQGLNRAVLVTSTGLQDVATVDTPGSKPGLQSLDVTGSMFVLQSKLPDIVTRVETLLAQAGITP